MTWLALVDSIFKHLDKGIQVDVLCFDFRIAFDRVDDNMRLSKLCSTGSHLNYSGSLPVIFVTGRMDGQYGCFVSETFHTHSGVRQGQILNPLLSGIIINDLAFLL